MQKLPDRKSFTFWRSTIINCFSINKQANLRSQQSNWKCLINDATTKWKQYYNFIKIKLYHTNDYIKYYIYEEVNQEFSKKRFDNSIIGTSQAIPETCIPINSTTRKEYLQMVEDKICNRMKQQSIKQLTN